ncbi:LysR family transcriptional regulator [Nitrospirillum sp. BR 11752]|uniref:DNA-binding transcriptional LysR family regulator n=1 Tax=Nitrospirillum amazonense TaxID=28077 RepID=A0A560GZX0_9PROT|nr:LysR family transcriptional regulator [Nitrospirillum amazonense]MEE3624346.1 LysR family transcriptional regulator [Nitrospirillum sp. BR 11752]TWB39595.1 DNA-binding transcriptional LysR family regulator [Nitrospirillum amazonense]
MESSFDWDALQSFLAVVRAGKLTAAARRMGVDHSTLSRRIADLERTLQTQLFTRSVQGYALTPQGEKLLASAQAMESVALGILGEVAGSSLKVAGTVRIGAPDGFGTVFLAPRLGDLGAAHPDLVVELVTTPRLFSLTKREADIAIGLAPPREGRLHARKLTDYRLGLYAAVDYLERRGAPQRRADLRDHRLIGYVGELIYAPELDYIPLIEKDLVPSITSSNLLAQYHMTLAGQGLCVLPCFMAGQEPRLRRVLPDTVSLTRSFWLIVHSDLRALARVRITSDFIVEAVRAERPIFLPDA